MNVRRIFPWVSVMVVALLVLGTFTGCESEDSPDTGNLDGYFDDNPYQTESRDSEHPRELGISPATAEITFIGQQYTFHVVGGTPPYRWDVSSGAAGSIVTLPDSSDAVYTANIIGPNTILAYDSAGKAGYADATGPTAALVATAAPDTITTPGGRSILTATGGTQPYNWAVSDVALGAIIGSNVGSEVVYQRSTVGVGDNTVSCTDGAGTVVFVLIKQP